MIPKSEEFVEYINVYQNAQTMEPALSNYVGNKQTVEQPAFGMDHSSAGPRGVPWKQPDGRDGSYAHIA